MARTLWCEFIRVCPQLSTHHMSHLWMFPQLNLAKSCCKTFAKYWQTNKASATSSYLFTHFRHVQREGAKRRGWITMQCLINLSTACGLTVEFAPGLFSAGNTSHGSTVWYPSSSTEMERQCARAHGQNKEASFHPFTVMTVSLKET